MRRGRQRSAALLLGAIALPVAFSAALILHELDHADEGHEHLLVVLHGHSHEFDAGDHQHPVVKSAGPTIGPTKQAAWWPRASRRLNPAGPSVSVDEPAPRHLEPPRSCDLCIWLL